MERFFSEFEPISYEEWERQAKVFLKGKPFDKLFTPTYEGFMIRPLYTISDLENIGFIKNEFPGLPNFLRSSKVTGYTLQPWKICQRVIEPNPKEANKIIKQMLENGANGIIVQHCDSNEPSLHPGIIIETIDDFYQLLETVNLGEISLFVHTNQPVLFSLLLNQFLTEKGINPRNLDIVFFYAPFNKILINGEAPNDLEYFYKEIYRVFYNLVQLLPNSKFLNVDASIFAEAGSNTVQEIAFALSQAVEYLKLLVQKGIRPEEVVSKLIFKFSIGTEIFFEIAKLRAVRLLWARILKEFNLAPDSYRVSIFTQTLQRNKSKLDIYVNMLRNTIETFASVVGEADYVEVLPFDHLVNPLNPFSLRNARNTQLVLLEEHNLIDTIDPVAGSWYLESLTFELARQSLEVFKRLEQNGGFLKSVINGIVQDEIANIVAKRESDMAERKTIRVGVNKFPYVEDKIEDVDVNLYLEKVNRLVREKRDLFSTFVAENIDISSYLEGEEESKDKLLELIRRRHPLFLFKESNADYNKQVKKLKIYREAEVFENLRERTKNLNKRNIVPKVLLLPFGKLSEYMPRVEFSKDFFLLVGFEVIAPNIGFNDLEDSFNFILHHSPKIVVFCSSDDLYPSFVPELAKKVKKENPSILCVLAGLPKDLQEEYKDAGVDYFIHLRTNVVKFFSEIFEKLT
ncbi:MAG: methylmalonyl-CoA mutase family protein [Ignavibacteria bacterium]|nr:methylmalonyl-CoA mutase family protein [Ignavibacteria bacterium]